LILRNDNLQSEIIDLQSVVNDLKSKNHDLKTKNQTLIQANSDLGAFVNQLNLGQVSLPMQLNI